MKNTILNHQSLNKDLATLLFRLIFGAMFVYYGYTKLASFNEILPMFGDIIGIGAKLSFSLVIFAELFCGFFGVGRLLHAVGHHPDLYCHGGCIFLLRMQKTRLS